MPIDTRSPSALSAEPVSPDLSRALRSLIAAADRLRHGRLRLILPNGQAMTFAGSEDGPHGHMTLNSDRVARRLLFGGDIGLAESYMDGDWDSPDLTSLLSLATLNEAALQETLAGSLLSRVVNRLWHLVRPNSRAGSRRNISAHYDLGNAFYRQWLDETMSYSAACFTPDTATLADAQREKYRRLARMLELKPGQRVLEIGCGWGGFAEIAAQDFGCRVTGLTLSTEQHAYASERMTRSGLSGQVEIALRDYRDETGTYDAIASIEMFEAVGEKYWPTYFDSLQARLRPGGKAALQVITIDDHRFQSYRKGCDFIQRYVFPGGLLPSPEALRQAATDGGFRITAEQFFGLDYALTLKAWAESFERAWPVIATQGYDDRFKRLWRYYLAYCEAGFRAGTIDVGHFLLERP